MSMVIPSSEYGRLLLENRSLIDVRAPIEFTKGAFSHSINLPLMQDSEREKVGTCYKKHGQDAAIALGHELVKGNVKQQRIDASVDTTSGQLFILFSWWFTLKIIPAMD